MQKQMWYRSKDVPNQSTIRSDLFIFETDKHSLLVHFTSTASFTALGRTRVTVLLQQLLTRALPSC